MKIRPHLGIAIFSIICMFVIAIIGTFLCWRFWSTDISLMSCLLLLFVLPLWLLFLFFTIISFFYYFIITKESIYIHSIFKINRIEIYKNNIKSITALYYRLGRPGCDSNPTKIVIKHDINGAIKEAPMRLWFNERKTIEVLISNDYHIDNLN